MTIDLRRLPPLQRYSIALAVMIPIAVLAWVTGKDEPVPGWLETGLIPVLAWCYIALGVGWVVRKIVARIRRS